MIVMEPTTDTPMSANLSGHSIYIPFYTSTSSSTEIRNKFQYTAGVTRTSNPRAALRDRQTLPPVRPGKASRRPASKSKSLSESSAARCRVIVRQELKLVKKKQLSKAQSHPENTQVGDSVNFQYSAMNPAAGDSSSAARSTLPAKHIYRRNASVCAIDKKGSYVHYLGRRIQLFKSQMTSYAIDVIREFNLASCKIDSCTQDLNREMNLMNAKIAPYTQKLKIKMKLLNSRAALYSDEISTITERLLSKVRSYAHHGYNNLRQLHLKIGPYVQDVDRQMKLIKSMEVLHREQFRRKFELIGSKADLFDQIKSEIKDFLI